MPKSLNKGESPRVPVKAPQDLIDRVRACLRPDENVSSFTRELWEREIEIRERLTKKLLTKK